MSKPREPVQLGPFYGGINTLSDPSGIEDNELVDCVNLELDLNGSLIVRPPITVVSNSPGVGSRARILGQAQIGSNYYLIVANDTTVYSFDGANFTEITTGLFASKAIQYRNNVYIVTYDSSPLTGGKWDGSTYTNIPTMPKGSDAVIYKERMWIPSGTVSGRLFFSDIADPDAWPSSNFFDISPGDGQSLWRVAVFTNNLLIFKSDCIFALSYETRPADATLDKISNTIGITNEHCFVQNQNNMFLYHEGYVYQLVNYEPVQINPRVVFEFDGFSPSTRADNIFLSFIGNRLIVRYFNRIYVYNILTQTWTRWASEDEDINNFAGFFEFPSDSSSVVDKTYYAGSSLVSDNKLYMIKNVHDNVQSEDPIRCSILTKDYTFELPWEYKRLFFWGVDIRTNRDVTGTVTPIVFGFTPSWGDIANKTWDELNTWIMPLTSSIQITSPVTGGAGTLKRFIKFNKSLRFRQINFRVDMETNGTLAEGPTRLYGLTLFLRAKQTVSKQVS